MSLFAIPTSGKGAAAQSQDRVREGVVVLMGTLARHLDPSSPWIKKVMQQLVEVRRSQLICLVWAVSGEVSLVFFSTWLREIEIWCCLFELVGFCLPRECISVLRCKSKRLATRGSVTNHRFPSFPPIVAIRCFGRLLIVSRRLRRIALPLLCHCLM